uniref:DoxX family membrane protein n=1 Tax=uncultured Draconibacterium sp. TaxID=1573823 RepID=UPI003217DA68
MKNTMRNTVWHQAVLFLLRIVLGWHILYEGLCKVADPSWSAKGYLQKSEWIISGFADWIINHATILNFVDFLNQWGLVCIGLGLILGLFVRMASIAGAALLFLYYLNNPPFLGSETLHLMEGNNLIVNKTLIESVALLVVAVFHTSSDWGLEMLYKKKLNKKTTLNDGK